MGRFMSPDWAAKEEPVPYATFDDPQSLNLYSYVRNNPLSRADKDGHCAEDLCIVEGGAAAGTGLYLLGAAAIAGGAAILHSPAGQRSFDTFTSAAGANLSSNFQAVKGAVTGFFSKSSSTTPAPTPATPATPTGTTPAPTTAGTQTGQPTSNPWTGQPGTTSQTAQPDGSPKQIRSYGSDGYPQTDVDHGHDHGQGDPHAHDIGRPADGSPPTHVDRGPGRPVQPNDPKPK